MREIKSYVPKKLFIPLGCENKGSKESVNILYNNKFKSDSQRLALSLQVSLVFMAQCFR
ncbi:hypothetical protein VAE122_3030081 [Vibrio aestuarianus]|nr:hypothetical protein VAE122_3030081 [Vibrio aestuarianus]